MAMVQLQPGLLLIVDTLTRPSDEPVVQPPDPEIPWMEASACQELPLAARLDFYADERDDPAAVARARAVCASCPVQMTCLDHALSIGERHGVWGGTSEEERRRVARGVHGTPERYQARRCRCGPCVVAFARKRFLQREQERLFAPDD
jgi:WhiB family redox-sensing transcriptional regulator